MVAHSNKMNNLPIYFLRIYVKHIIWHVVGLNQIIHNMIILVISFLKGLWDLLKKFISILMKISIMKFNRSLTRNLQLIINNFRIYFYHTLLRFKILCNNFYSYSLNKVIKCLSPLFRLLRTII